MNSLRDLWEDIQRSNIHETGVECEEKKFWPERFSGEIMSGNFLHLMKNINLQTEEAQ